MAIIHRKNNARVIEGMKMVDDVSSLTLSVRWNYLNASNEYISPDLLADYSVWNEISNNYWNNQSVLAGGSYPAVYTDLIPFDTSETDQYVFLSELPAVDGMITEIFYYTNAEVFISMISNSTDTVKMYTVPANTAYIRLQMRCTNSANEKVLYDYRDSIVLYYG